MAGAAPSGDEESITAINLTPLVDVSLVLVIIFMAIAPFALTAGIKVLESKAGAAKGKVSAAKNVSINLTRKGKLTVNGKKSEFGTLARLIGEELTKSKDKMVILTADDENRVGEVVLILDTAKQAGAKKIAIMSRAKPVKGRGKRRKRG